MAMQNYLNWSVTVIKNTKMAWKFSIRPFAGTMLSQKGKTMT